MYITQAEAFEAKKMYKDAEKLYMQVSESECILSCSIFLTIRL